MEILEQAYIFASKVKEHQEEATVILIDDFDLSVASTFDDRKYTVNTQLLTGFLMNLADDPTRCGDERTCRIPIILTGNNFIALHSPLTRDGRMNFFEWKPDVEEKQEIVSRIFKALLVPKDIPYLTKLVKAFPDHSVSFFAALKEDWIDMIILQSIKRNKGYYIDKIENAVRSAMNAHELEYKVLYDLAHARSTKRATNFLDAEFISDDRE